ncbi:MgtC/SapB family protein [Stutzerimonas stutzeri]|uniref:MgtC/SapB family protein n=1 Tax=Stutzerimonas TaxID=2901164 RepID=UPI001BAFD251|nr:MgtC/SapB family protein [Stutzerimonas stutzeri]QUE74498.1 MgtC/SapB family protein [Stutzerimonas stutzeri]
MSYELSLNLATALGVGLLIGTERSWSGRGNTDGMEELAGIRTFGLCGLLGGLAALSAGHFGALAWIAVFVVLALLTIAGYLIESRSNADYGMTTEVALLLTFLLGSLAVVESRLLAASLAVVVALLLSLKARLHGALRKLSEAELSGALKLLFISVVLLPALPNEGYGPWQAFNPYTTWWMVVLIAGIGFAAYVAIRLLGTRHGLLVTALLGGIVSSTAMTITLARLDAEKLRPALAAGLLATSALMFPRVLLEVGLINRELLPSLLAPMLTAGSIYAGGAFFYYLRAAQQPENAAEPPLKNPFELGPALRFGGLLVVILFVVEGARRLLGDTGIYLVSLLSGLTDVDAITLSLSNSARTDLSELVAVRGIFLAAFSNSLVKAGLILLIGGRALATLTLPFMFGGLLAGLAVLWLL